VPGQDVAELVREHELELVEAEQLERRRVEHDERPVDAHHSRAEERRLRDVQLGQRVDAQDRAGFDVPFVDRAQLLRPHAYGRGEEREPQRAIPDAAECLAHEQVEARHGAQRRAPRDPPGCSYARGERPAKRRLPGFRHGSRVQR
jgi:hypothetical protein